MMQVKTCPVPEGSLIAHRLPGAYFYDAWSLEPNDGGLCALAYFLRAAQTTPTWINLLMSLRNQVVAHLGLKDLGHLNGFDADKPVDQYKTGCRVGIFTLLENHSDEALLGDSDKHLDVVLSVHKAKNSKTQRCVITVSTVVHTHNLLGRLYMLPVAPVHKLIVPSMLRAAA